MRAVIRRIRAFFRELKRREVYRVAAAYLLAAFVALQLAELAAGAFDLPDWFEPMVWVLCGLGFPIALALGWAFDLTSDGIQREEPAGGAGENDGAPEHPPIGGRPHQIGYIVLGSLLLLGALLYAGTRVFAPGDGAPPDPASIHSLAVLPLDNLSGDPEQEYFTIGMTEALTAELGQIGALKVISRTSAMRYAETDMAAPEIARDLDVDALIEGSVLRADDEVRITLQLVHGPTDRHIWAQSYEREMHDILALQGEVARRIAREIQVTLTPEETERLAGEDAVDPEAYDAYLKGNALLLERVDSAFPRAARQYREAVAIDPDFAPAHAGLALTYIQMAWWLGLPPGEQTALVSRAREATQHALERDSTLAEAHIALGWIRYLFEWDWEGADTAFRHGISLNPSATPARLVYVTYLISMGRHGEAVAEARRAVERDPFSAAAQNDLGFALDHAGRHAEAQEQRRKALELAPGNGGIRLGQAVSYAQAGRWEEALRHAARADSLIEGPRLPVENLQFAYVYARSGRLDAASRILDELRGRNETQSVGPSMLALVHVALGQEEKALDLLERAYEVRGLGLVFAKGYFMYDPLRDEPRFQELLRRMNFPEVG